MDKLSKEELDNLTELAEAATPGPWYSIDSSVYWDVKDSRYCVAEESEELTAGDYPGGNAAFIAAANPNTVRRMALELQALRATPPTTGAVEGEVEQSEVERFLRLSHALDTARKNHYSASEIWEAEERVSRNIGPKLTELLTELLARRTGSAPTLGEGASPAQSWVSVKERLPEDHETYFVWLKSLTGGPSRLDVSHLTPAKNAFYVDYDEEGIAPIEEVTHWLIKSAVPTPPQQKGAESHE